MTLNAMQMTDEEYAKERADEIRGRVVGTVSGRTLTPAEVREEVEKELQAQDRARWADLAELNRSQSRSKEPPKPKLATEMGAAEYETAKANAIRNNYR